MTQADIEFVRIGVDGDHSRVTRAVAVEVPVAIEINGIGYAVMMATPADLTDFGYGFVWSERLVDARAEIVSVDPVQGAHGHRLLIRLVPERTERLLERFRHRVSDSSCGMCGIESLEQAMRPLPVVAGGVGISDAAIFRSLSELRAWQPLNAATGAVHAAARCSAEGQILDAREDVGRHNAFDKLVGAMLQKGATWDDGFALLSSRCSYELVEKAALSNCPTLVTISAPTTLAVERATAAGIQLVVLARSDAVLASDPDANRD